MFDKRRLQQVLYNLLTNAIKFTRKGKITISAKVKPRTDQLSGLMLSIAITDEGIGMSAQDCERVFDGFLVTRNQDSQNLNPYGNGIGL